jgi:hypothetical protein
MQIVYFGVPAAERMVVRYLDKDDPSDKGANLPLRDDLAQHAPAFDWGKAMVGERESRALVVGASQLALAICAHALADDARALKLHQRFKLRVMGGWLAGKAWAITAEEVATTCDAIEADELTPQQKAEIERDKPVIEREGGRGVEGAIVWDTDESGQRIRQRGE